MNLRLGDVRPEHLDEVSHVRDRSFGLSAPEAQEQWRVAAAEFCAGRRFLGVFDADRLVAAGGLWDFRQWWHGRRIPMAGVAGVVVAPEHRGRGVGKLLMRGVLQRSLELGFAMAALYPATVPMYRRLGFEFGGARYRFAFGTEALRALDGTEVALREAGPDEAPRLQELVSQARQEGRESGLLDWPEPYVRRWLGERGTFCYLADDGFVVYSWDGQDLRVDELVASSEPTARALWATVGSGASIARRVTAFSSPQDPVHLLVDHEAEHQVSVERWMVRLLDAPAAVAARGWPEGLELDTPLSIDDPELAGNRGAWRLQISGGSGRLERTGADNGGAGVALGARGLAGLFAGVPMTTLRRAGTATGGAAATDAPLDAAFAGPTPYMLDYF